MGSGGPPGGPTHPKWSHGLLEGVDQPLVGWMKPPLKPKADWRWEGKKPKGGKGFQVERRNPTPSRIGVRLLHLQISTKP